MFMDNFGYGELGFYGRSFTRGDATLWIDTLATGLVLACGDSGEGFKMSALMGEVLADLAEGHTPDRDIAELSMHRFAAGIPHRARPHALGRH